MVWDMADISRHGGTEMLARNMGDHRPMEVYLAQPRGFCAGVVRAIQIVERALEKYGPPVYVRHEIVHNKYVVESLKNKGAIFVEDLSEVPPLSVTVFSAHGVARTVEEEAAARNLPVINATCPLVTKVHNQGTALGHIALALIVDLGHERAGRIDDGKISCGGFFLDRARHAIGAEHGD